MSATEPTVPTAIAAALPVTVAAYGRDYLDLGWINLWGPTTAEVGWALMVACEFRFDAPDFSWDSSRGQSAETVARRLVGTQLLRVELDDTLVNPVLHFSGHQRLSLIADTGMDPWTLSLPGMLWTLVGLHEESSRRGPAK